MKATMKTKWLLMGEGIITHYNMPNSYITKKLRGFKVEIKDLQIIYIIFSILESVHI
jgi:hypothetical protein